jgi:hypothetical protein
MMTSTGSEGRCDLCGRSKTRDHDMPWQKITEQEYIEEQRERLPRSDADLSPDAPHTDTSYPARQERLNALKD